MLAQINFPAIFLFFLYFTVLCLYYMRKIYFPPFLFSAINFRSIFVANFISHYLCFAGIHKHIPHSYTLKWTNPNTHIQHKCFVFYSFFATFISCYCNLSSWRNMLCLIQIAACDFHFLSARVKLDNMRQNIQTNDVAHIMSDSLIVIFLWGWQQLKESPFKTFSFLHQFVMSWTSFITLLSQTQHIIYILCSL